MLNRCYKGIIISGIMHLMWQVTVPWPFQSFYINVKIQFFSAQKNGEWLQNDWGDILPMDSAWRFLNQKSTWIHGPQVKIEGREHEPTV